MYTISLTALWVYDYFLTVDDEVVESAGDDGTERNLTTLIAPLRMGNGEHSQCANLRTFAGLH